MRPRVFRIHDRGTLMRVASELTKLMVSESHPVMVEVADYREQRSIGQNRLLHAILRDVSENLEVAGQRFSQEAWKEEFRQRFIGTEEIELPGGRRVERGISTTTLDREQMSIAVDHFLAWLATDYGYAAEEQAA